MKQTLHEETLHEAWNKTNTLWIQSCPASHHMGEEFVMLHWGWHRVWRKPSQRQLVRIRIEKKGRNRNWERRGEGRRARMKRTRKVNEGGKGKPSVHSFGWIYMWRLVHYQRRYCTIRLEVMISEYSHLQEVHICEWSCMLWMGKGEGGEMEEEWRRGWLEHF